MEITMKLVYQYMIIFFNFTPTSNHLHPLQVENCDSNSRLVVDEDNYGKVRLERANSAFVTKSGPHLKTLFDVVLSLAHLIFPTTQYVYNLYHLYNLYNLYNLCTVK